MLGGGLIEMDGRYGLGCDNVAKFQYILANGSRVSATAKVNSELFWASCGGGGGLFGIVFGMTMKLGNRTPYDRNAFFRYDWEISRAAEVVQAYSSWDLSEGNISLKLKSDFAVIPPVIRAFGVCWDVDSDTACEAALNNTSVFAVPGRIKRLNQFATSILDALKFMGKAGNYGQKIPFESLTFEMSFLNQSFEAASKSNSVRWANTVLTYQPRPGLGYFQRVIDFCASSGISTKPSRINTVSILD